MNFFSGIITFLAVAILIILAFAIGLVLGFVGFAFYLEKAVPGAQDNLTTQVREVRDRMKADKEKHEDGCDENDENEDDGIEVFVTGKYDE
jgi:hypothetical protein